ncbi:probable Pleiotropic ABC efflux transporter of multiple drugs [Hanseniaspora guilliermondii]|uniref:Probable Pleiotropic ABC efflux transporter of multiple drugs n=1 Tax=Hanseniaspora guilliermondii TaxID=56406 RepID=A0A1L0D227_9ASCO|nr:probable Pleiotropic ABC efflux transporter of multiple drugs [Hanseniaspora guilliermondii]
MSDNSEVESFTAKHITTSGEHRDPYDGVPDTNSVQSLARTFTHMSLASNNDNQVYGVPIDGEEGVESYNPKIDPNSEEFDAHEWMRNLNRLRSADKDYYKNISLGMAYKNLSAFGDSSDVVYQPTVLNVFQQTAENIYRKLRKSRPSDKFTILKPMDGILKPGSLNVVLGKPGSGCSTLLKTLSASTFGFEVTSDSVISYDGITPKEIQNNYRGDVVYQAEADIHFPHLTVFETLNNIALLTTPSNRIKGLTREQFSKHMAEATMAMYGLSHTRNTKVGNELVRGVSGGERKRVSICEISLVNGKIVCYDNSTRGLDSASTLSFIKSLKTQSKTSDTTSVVAIYQCSQEAYDLFDNVIVLDEGYQLYNGPANKAKQYFEDMGYVCPERQTTADFLTAVTSPTERIKNTDMLAKGIKIPDSPLEMYEYWNASEQRKTLNAEIDDYLSNIDSSLKDQFHQAHTASQAKRARPSSSYLLTFQLQVKYLLQRNFARIRNNIGLSLFQVLGNSFMALIIASMFYKVMYYTNTSTFFYRGGTLFYAVLFNSFSSLLEIMTLYEARPIIEKQKNLAMYHPSAEAMSSILSEMPAKLVTAIAFNLFYYFLTNLNRNPGAFFFYLLMNFICLLAMSHLFRFIGSATKSFPEAMVPASVILLAISMYTGFAIPKTSMLGWSKWIYWINPIQYGFESLMINEFHGRKFPCSSYIPSGQAYSSFDAVYKTCSVVGAVPGADYVDGDTFLRLSYGYEHSHKWRGFGVVLAYAIFLFFVYLTFTEYNESAKQKGEIIVFPQAIVRKIKKMSKVSNDLESASASDDSYTDKKMVSDDYEESQDGDDGVGLSESEATLHWRNLCYDVQIKGETRRILNNVDGWVAKNSITALMGSSGAGKTTLMDCLASRVTMGVITGDILVNGRLRDEGFPRSIGYCQQQDLHLATATVRESLKFSAYLRQPASVSKEEKDAYVESVIKILDMEKYADAVVGVMGEGLNVEQRKRLTIGVELAAKPKLLMFLDEPTSGLDSQTAWSICQLMRKLANHGQAILCTIHQPSAMLIEQFDRLLFLQKGGKTAYFGDLGKGCRTMIDYFESKGAPKCPPTANPAEWMLDIVQARDYHDAWKSSEEFKQVHATLDEMERELPNIPISNADDTSAFAASFPVQLRYVYKRAVQQYWRTPIYLWAKFFVTIASEIFIGFTFFKANHSLQGLQNQMLAIFMFVCIFNPFLQQYLPIYTKQRDLYEARERPSRTFSWYSFLLAQMLAEFVPNLLCAAFSFFCFYYPIGFAHNANYSGQLSERSGLFFFYCLAFYTWMGSTTILVAAPFEDPQAGGNLASLMFTMALSFNGVFVGPHKLPGFWMFMYRVSPLTYFTDGALSIGLANNPVKCSDYEYTDVNAPNGMTCGEYLSPYIKAAGTGYIVDENATGTCKVCKISSTNAFLSSVSSKYSRRWSSLGIFLAYIAFNYSMAFFLYWWARVPKKADRVSDKKDPSEEKIESKE